MMQTVDFVYSVELLKNPTGFGLSIAHDSSSNFTFLEAQPNNASLQLLTYTFHGGSGGSVEVPVVYILGMYYIYWECIYNIYIGKVLNVIILYVRLLYKLIIVHV